MGFTDTTPFAPPFSTVDNPRLELVMEVRVTQVARHAPQNRLGRVIEVPLR